MKKLDPKDIESLIEYLDAMPDLAEVSYVRRGAYIHGKFCLDLFAFLVVRHPDGQFSLKIDDMVYSRCVSHTPKGEVDRELERLMDVVIQKENGIGEGSIKERFDNFVDRLKNEG